MTDFHEQQKAGVLLLNKPRGVTSTRCVSVVKRLVPKGTKVGHAGTLDDFASGLLIICVGRATTRLVPRLMDLNKEYYVKARLGELTDSLDLTGKELEGSTFGHVDEPSLMHAIKLLQPAYDQVPPVFSALKHKGVPLYDLVRKKQASLQDVAAIAGSKTRRVHLYEADLLALMKPFFLLRVLVSKGTYVRSLAHDIAVALGTVATTYELERTKIGPYSLEQAIDLSDVQSCGSIDPLLISPEDFLDRLINP